MRWPTLLGGLLRTADIPDEIARTSGTIARSAIGAAGGVASLAGGMLPLSQVPAGWVHRVRWDGSWPSARPTSRTDITVVCEAPSSIGPAVSWPTLGPTWMLTNDRLIIRDYDEPVGAFGADAYGEGIYGG